MIRVLLRERIGAAERLLGSVMLGSGIVKDDSVFGRRERNYPEIVLRGGGKRARRSRKGGIR